MPDLRVAKVPERNDDLLRHDLPLEPEEIARLRRFAARLAELCAELAAHGVAETVQHDDLHLANVYERGGRFRLLDWGDTSIAHPFASLVVPFRFLEEINRLPPTDPWFERLREAYLEPWGSGFGETFALAVRIGAFAYPIAPKLSIHGNGNGNGNGGGAGGRSLTLALPSHHRLGPGEEKRRPPSRATLERSFGGRRNLRKLGARI